MPRLRSKENFYAYLSPLLVLLILTIGCGTNASSTSSPNPEPLPIDLPSPGWPTDQPPRTDIGKLMRAMCTSETNVVDWILKLEPENRYSFYGFAIGHSKRGKAIYRALDQKTKLSPPDSNGFIHPEGLDTVGFQILKVRKPNEPKVAYVNFRVQCFN